MNIIENDKKYIANTYSRFPTVADCGKGSIIWDTAGKEYIDLASGIAVNSFGICDEEWIAAVEKQLHKLQHISNLYYTEPQVTLAKMLCEKTGMEKVFFSNSGAEANECAIKCARKYSNDKYGSGRYKILSLINSFHGRSLATLSATGQENLHKDFSPLVDGFKYIPADDFKALEKSCDDTVCALILELVQGEGGVNALDKSYVAQASKLCADKDILLIIDEVQSGNGRSGTLYAYMQYDIEPDIVTTAKGLSGGLPLGACMMGKKTKNTLSPGSHGSTFGGNPICAAGAISILSRIDEKLLKSVKEKSVYISSQLKDAEGVCSLSGLGLMIGVETKRDAKQIAAECLKQGLIILTAKSKLRLLPPLNIEMPVLEKALRILKGVIGNEALT